MGQFWGTRVRGQVKNLHKQGSNVVESSVVSFLTVQFLTPELGSGWLWGWNLVPLPRLQSGALETAWRRYRVQDRSGGGAVRSLSMRVLCTSGSEM